MCCSVTLQVCIKSTGMWCATPTVSLIKKHYSVGGGIKKPPVPGNTSRTRSAMQDGSRLATWIATSLPVDGIAITHLYKSLLVWLDFRIQIDHILPSSHSLLC